MICLGYLDTQWQFISALNEILTQSVTNSIKIVFLTSPKMKMEAKQLWFAFSGILYLLRHKSQFLRQPWCCQHTSFSLNRDYFKVRPITITSGSFSTRIVEGKNNFHYFAENLAAPNLVLSFWYMNNKVLNNIVL